MRPRFRLGLRTIKTALSVMLSLYFASLFGELSIFPALASVSVMSRTFEEGLRECRNQSIGILIGGLFGCLTTYLCPYPSIWIMGLGVMVIIFVCASFHVGFSCSLSSAIFIVACMSEPATVFRSVMIRFFHTAIGLGVGLTINYSIVPYNNSKKIYELIQDYLTLVPVYLEQRIYQNIYPDLKQTEDIRDRLEYEMTIYRHQRFLKKKLHRDVYSHMAGCLQLIERIHQELTVLCSMDAIGRPNADQLLQLQCMGIAPPDTGYPVVSATPESETVAQYHLNRLISARTHLIRLLDTKA